MARQLFGGQGCLSFRGFTFTLDSQADIVDQIPLLVPKCSLTYLQADIVDQIPLLVPKISLTYLQADIVDQIPLLVPNLS